MDRDQLGSGSPGTDEGNVSEQRRGQSRIGGGTEPIDESVAIDICGRNSRRDAATTERSNE